MQGKLFDEETAKEPRRETFLNKIPSELQEYMGITYDEGIGEAVRQVYRAAWRHNLGIEPYKKLSEDIPVLRIILCNTRVNLLQRLV